MKKIVILIVILIFQYISKAQGNLSPEEFEKLWNHASTGKPIPIENKTIKDTVSFEEKWKKLDSLQKVNPKAASDLSKTINTSTVVPTKSTISKPDIIKEIPVDKKVDEFKAKTEIKKEISVEKKVEEVKAKTEIKKDIPVEKKIEEVKAKTEIKKEVPVEKKTDIIKTKVDNEINKVPTTTLPEKPKVVTKPINVDTSKNYKEFQFETTPVVNGNATYNLPEPKYKNTVDKSDVTKETSINKKIKENKNPEAETSYKEFSKEADLIRKENDRKLDSILKAVNISISKPLDMNEYIDIYMEGGELMKNGNSKIYDRISILNNGKIHRELATQNIGEQKVEKNVTRNQVVKIAQFISDMGFFDYKDIYDCPESDKNCLNRLKTDPIPIPLKLTITIGNKKHSSVIYYYNPSKDKNWVNYPDTLDKIVNAIYALVER